MALDDPSAAGLDEPLIAKSSSSAKQSVAQSAGADKRRCCHGVRKFFLYDAHRPEIQAFYLNQFGRSVLFISFLFLSLGILELANTQAGCAYNPETEQHDICTNDNKAYGVKPASILALMALVGGVATSAFMPFAGAMVDYTNHRRAFGVCCAITLIGVNFAQIFLFEETWFAMTILQAIIGSASVSGNAMVMWSNLTTVSCKEYALHGITASGRMWETTGLLSYFIIVAAVGLAAGWNAVQIARFGQATAVIMGGPPLLLSYKKYQSVSAIKELPSGRNLYTASVMELWSTIKELGKSAPGAQRFLIMLMFSGASILTLVTLFIAWFTDFLEVSAKTTVIFILIQFACNPIGVIIHRALARRFGHKRNFCVMLMFWIILLALTLSLLDGPEKGKFVLVIAPFIGTGFGWYYPSSNGFFVSLVPLDAVTELWGWNMLATVILSFVPPLVFMAVNEAGGNLQLGFMGSMIFLVIGFFLALTITTSDTDAKTVRASSHSILAGTMADDDESGDDDDTDGDVAGTNDEEKNYWKDSTVVDSSVV